MIARIHKGILLASVLILNGCSSLMTVGEEEYSCPGRPSGVRCMSSSEVYQLTHQTDTVTEAGNKGNAVEAKNNKTTIVQPSLSDIKHASIALHPGNIIPLRTPSGIMRIWFNSWEDQNEDLHSSEFVFTEIEKRRWIVGEPYVKDAAPLNPLRSKLFERGMNDAIEPIEEVSSK